MHVVIKQICSFLYAVVKVFGLQVWWKSVHIIVSLLRSDTNDKREQDWVGINNFCEMNYPAEVSAVVATTFIFASSDL